MITRIRRYFRSRHMVPVSRYPIRDADIANRWI